MQRQTHVTFLAKDSPSRIHTVPTTTINFAKRVIRNGSQLKVSDYVFCKEQDMGKHLHGLFSTVGPLGPSTMISVRETKPKQTKCQEGSPGPRECLWRSQKEGQMTQLPHGAPKWYPRRFLGRSGFLCWQPLYLPKKIMAPTDFLLPLRKKTTHKERFETSPPNSGKAFSTRLPVRNPVLM